MSTTQFRPCQVPDCRAQSPSMPRVGGKFMCIRHQAHLRAVKKREREAAVLEQEQPSIAAAYHARRAAAQETA